MSSSPSSPRDLSAAEEEQVQQWLAQAEAAAQAEDWEKTIALYRQALAFDRYLQGVEAKLQWALRMREIDRLYREGRAKLQAGEYEAALTLLRKARMMYASHYKDVDALIVQAQTELQKAKWQARPASAKQPRAQSRGTWFYLGVLAVIALIVLVLVLWLWRGVG